VGEQHADVFVGFDHGSQLQINEVIDLFGGRENVHGADRRHGFEEFRGAGAGSFGVHPESAVGLHRKSPEGAFNYGI